MRKYIAPRGLLSILALAVLAAGTLIVMTRRSSTQEFARTIEFNNTYGATTLRVFVQVDGGPESSVQATCDPMTCTFQLPLTNAPHSLSVAVEQNGERGVPSITDVNTSDMS